MNIDRLLSVQDVYNVIMEHMRHLDTLWPEGDERGPRKVDIVELLEGIKLRLVQVAEKNAEAQESAFEKAARKITGAVSKPASEPHVKPHDMSQNAKSAMQLAHEAAQSRIKGRQ